MTPLDLVLVLLVLAQVACMILSYVRPPRELVPYLAVAFLCLVCMVLLTR